MFRRASYPDVEKFVAERADIEAAWPAYATDPLLRRPPHFLSVPPERGGNERGGNDEASPKQASLSKDVCMVPFCTLR